MKHILKIFLAIALFSSMAFADGDMGGGGVANPGDMDGGGGPVEIVCDGIVGDMGGGGIVCQDGRSNESFLDAVTSYLDSIF